MHDSMDSEPFAFVSYSRLDRTVVLNEIRRLRACSYRLWYDEGDIELTEEWREEIRVAVTRCALFILFVTTNSMASENVHEEIVLATKLSKRRLVIFWEVVCIDDCLPVIQEGFKLKQGILRYTHSDADYFAKVDKTLCKAIGRSISSTPSQKCLPIERPRSVLPPLPSVLAYTLAALSAIFLAFASVVVASSSFASLAPADPVLRIGGFCFGALLFIAGCSLSFLAVLVRKLYPLE